MFELLAELFSRSFKKFKAAQDGTEKRVQLINIIFWTICAFISLIFYIPRGLSTIEVLISIVVFVFTIYSVIRALKYFKIL